MPLSLNAKRRRDRAAKAAERKRVNLCAGDPRRAYSTPHHATWAVDTREYRPHVADHEVAAMRGANMTIKRHRAVVSCDFALPDQRVATQQPVAKVSTRSDAIRRQARIARADAVIARAKAKGLVPTS